VGRRTSSSYSFSPPYLLYSSPALAILFEMLPYHMVWGGRLKSEKEMVRFEIVSIVTNLVFPEFVLLHANIISFGLPRKVIIAWLWIMTGLFL
jgi:hypothetical protein